MTTPTILRRRCAVAAACLIAVATAFAGVVPASVAHAEQQDPPSVAGHVYDALPYSNPDVTVTQIDTSAKPAYLRNPIGQDEGSTTPDDLSSNYYSADAAAVEYDGKLFVFTGHDEASPTYGSFNMKDWGVYVTDDPGSGTWTHYKNVARADLFSWATGDGAYAGQVVVDDGGTKGDTSDDWFYYYIPVKDKNAAAGGDPFSIGVAKSRSPLGPWTDAIGAPLLTTTQTGIETIDPAFFVDDDGTAYLHFGTFNSQLAVTMVKQPDGRTSYTKVATVDGTAGAAPKIYNMRDADGLKDPAGYDPARDTLGSAYSSTVLGDLSVNGGAYANGPKGFFEAAWVFRKGDTYYNVYDGGKPGSGNATCVQSNYQACVEYSTSSSPLGPWTYQGVLVQSGSATTMHPSVLPFKGDWWVTYHTADKAGGTDFRRAVSIDRVTWSDGTMSATAHPTAAERISPSRNVAPYATVSATYTETASWKGSVNDGRVLETAVVPPNHWDNYRKMPQAQSADSLIYQWNGAVHIDSAKVWFDVDSNALRAPASWKLRYLAQDGNWQDVPKPDAYTTGTGKSSPNTVSFGAVTTTALKLDMNAEQVDGGYASVAVPEWEVYAADEAPVAVPPAGVSTTPGTVPVLPSGVDVRYGSSVVRSPVVWRPVDAAQYTNVPDGTTFTVQGVVAGVGGESSAEGNVSVTVTVDSAHAPDADTNAPIVSVALAGVSGSDGWLVSSPVAVVGATDDGVRPVSRLEISTDSGALWRTVATDVNIGSAAVGGQGHLEVWARATDAAGNISQIARTSADVDSTAPTVEASVQGQARTLTLMADDGGGSGVQSVEYRISDGAWTPYTRPIAASGPARMSVSFRATDRAGNLSTVGTADIPSDASVPLTGYIEGDAVASDPQVKASTWTKGVAALNDGVVIPDGCTVENECIWGTWPNTGVMNLDYEWDREVTVDASRVQFTADGGGLGIPASWRLQFWDAEAGAGAGAFVDVPDATYTLSSNTPGSFGIDNGGWSEASWPVPVSTTKLRLVITSGAASPAVAEWQVHAPESPSTVDKGALESAVTAALGLDQNRYTADSWVPFAQALSDAQAVLADDAATQDAVDAALRTLRSAMDALTTDPDPSTGTVTDLDGGRRSVAVGGEVRFDEPVAVSGFVTRALTKAPEQGRAWLASVHYAAEGAARGEHPFVVSYTMADGAVIRVTYTPVVSAKPSVDGKAALPTTGASLTGAAFVGLLALVGSTVCMPIVVMRAWSRHRR